MRRPMFRVRILRVAIGQKRALAAVSNCIQLVLDYGLTMVTPWTHHGHAMRNVPTLWFGVPKSIIFVDIFLHLW